MRCLTDLGTSNKEGKSAINLDNLGIDACFACSWKLPAYNCLQVELFSLQWESVSQNCLTELSAEKLNCKQKGSNCK